MLVHAFVEDVSVASIARVNDNFATTDLRSRLRRHHGDNVDGVFRGWADNWLHPDFRRTFVLTGLLPEIRIPVLVIQGEDDEYGTLAQVDVICAGVSGPSSRLILPSCGDSPHRDRPQETLLGIVAFVEALP